MNYRTARRHAAGFLVVLVTAFGPGCTHFHQSKFNRPDGVGEDRILLIPFREPKKYAWYGESKHGRIVAETVRSWAMMNATPSFAEGREADQVLRIVSDWGRDDIKISDWESITATLDAKYVLIGTIEDFSLHKSKSIGVLDPWVKASYTLIDVSGRPKTAWERKGLTATLGKGKLTDTPIINLEVDTSRYERELLVKLGEQIGKDLYGYTTDLRYN